MIANILTDYLVPIAIGIVGIVAFGGVLWVRFKGGSLEELREAIQTAKNEIDISNTRSQRLEREARETRHSVDVLRDRIVALESENAILRGAISSGSELAPEFAEAIVQALNAHENRSQAKFEAALDRFEERIRERHQKFTDMMSTPEAKAALKAALGEPREV